MQPSLDCHDIPTNIPTEGIGTAGGTYGGSRGGLFTRLHYCRMACRPSCRALGPLVRSPPPPPPPWARFPRSSVAPPLEPQDGGQQAERPALIPRRRKGASSVPAAGRAISHSPPPSPRRNQPGTPANKR
ncbi:hypothetical protein PLESTM_000599700 [Pleodorina starrii]|nr:hypothetical protein PLESTM_000599700 [Pleodorina starrii]